MQNPRILTVGDVTAELILTCDGIPLPGRRKTGDQSYYLPGGKGLHTAVALARLGADSVLAGRLGDDLNGTELVDYLRSEKVDTRFLVRERETSSPLAVRLQETGSEERCLYYPGAGDAFCDQDVEGAFICYPDAVILHGELPYQVCQETAKLAKEQRLPLFLTSLPDPDRYPLRRFHGFEILTLDEEETQRATGIRPADQERCMKACMALTQQVRAKYVILRLGERGCFLFDGLYYDFFSSYDVPQPEGVNSDEAFSAALVLEYLRSEGDIRRTCEFATIASALYLTRGGGLRGYPTLEDMGRFVRRNEIEFEME